MYTGIFMEMVEEHIKKILKNRKIHFTLIDPDEQTPQEALEIAEEAILGGTDGDRKSVV